MSDEPSEIDVGDSTQVQGRSKDIRLAEREEGAALSQLLGSPAGRRFVYKLLESCHIYSTSFRNSVAEMAFAEGERNIGLRLVAAIQTHCAPRYLEMIQEASENERSREPRSKPVARNIADSPFGLGHEFGDGGNGRDA